ncbi:uncharacterized protein LOC123518057 isoform X2 [Portunus trituberculatus]|uniref:uncharacterized protein LOC123518057 isoform X2 n=1 Tax=Portunus trituberculatus TaxID=210409 RepID=UPI001E1D218B|nr:uncharacterized protein LOC123518057 isoform X2 [Portunus trituberculatus]
MDGRPAPDVTLKLGEDVLPSHKTVKQETLLKHRRTTHAAVLEPTEDLSGSEVTCLADSPLLLQQASVLLDVTYRPRVKLVIGDNLEPHKVNENDTFSFHCKVSANPEAVNVSWSFNGEELKSNASAGISMEGPTLSLMSLGKSSSGNYRCSATNTEGTGVSKPQYLRVRTKPEAVTSCNATSSNPGEGKAVNLEVKCVAEPAMDASKYFRLKAENLNTGVVKEKTNLLKPVFTITGLTEGKYNLSVTAGNSLGKSPPYTFTHTVCVPPATSGASSISPTPPLLSFSLSTAFSSPISPYSTNSLSFKTPRPHSSSVSHHSSPTSSWSPWRSHWAVFILVMVVMAAIHIGCLIPQLLVTFFIYKIEERRPSPLRQRVSSPRFRRRKSRNSNRELIRAHRLSEPPMQLPTITISPPASAPCTPLTSRKGSLTLNELEGYSIIGAKRAPHASVDSMELSSLCLSVQNEQLDTCSIQDDTVQNGHPRNGTMLPPPSKNGWVPTNEPFLNSNFQDAFLQYNFIEKDSLKRDLMKRPRSRPSSPNFLTVHTPVRKSLKEPSYKA